MVAVVVVVISSQKPLHLLFWRVWKVSHNSFIIIAKNNNLIKLSFTIEWGDADRINCVFIKAELTAVGSFPPVTNYNTQIGAGFGVAAQSDTQALLQTAVTVTCSLDASLEIEISFMSTGVVTDVVIAETAKN